MSVIGDCPGGMHAALVGIAFSTGARRARYLPIGHTALDEPSALNPKNALAALKGILENPAIAKIGHDLKFDLMMLSHEWITLAGIEFDTMLASYVSMRRDRATPSRNRARISGLQGADAETLRHRAEGHRTAHLPAARSSASRASVPTSRAARREVARPSRRGRTGATVPRDGAAAGAGLGRHRTARRAHRQAALASQSTRIDAELASRSAKIFELAGESFNINSPSSSR